MWLYGLAFLLVLYFWAYFPTVYLYCGAQFYADLLLSLVYRELLDFVIYFYFEVSEKLMTYCYYCFIGISDMLLVMWKKESHAYAVLTRR
jgi:hypothetical protein